MHMVIDRHVYMHTHMHARTSMSTCTNKLCDVDEKYSALAAEWLDRMLCINIDSLITAINHDRRTGSHQLCAGL